MKASVTLRKAAAEIQRRGWHQGDYGSDRNDPENCSVCALGAVRAALTGSPWESMGTEAPFAFAKGGECFYLLKVLPGINYIDSWNDRAARSQDEVVATFEQAALLAESEGN